MSAATVLPLRTACGLAFDRLSETERNVHQDTASGHLQWRFVGHHRPPARTAPWSVAWSNGTHRVALTLAASPGAWAFAQSYFDRAPAALAWLLCAQAFEPWWAARADGPWVPAAVGTERYETGGARCHASVVERALAFEFELAFSSPQAARSLIASDATGGTTGPRAAPDFHIPCEIRLGRLQLKPDRIARLRAGDVLLIGAMHSPPIERESAEESAHAELAPPTTATLCAGARPRAVALLLRGRGQWHVAGFPHFLDSEHPMEDPSARFGSAAPDFLNDPLARIDVAVDIVAARLTMRAAALQALQPGEVLALDHDVDEARVEVRVAGERFATGVLIAFEGRLAVQLVEVGIGPGPRAGTADWMPSAPSHA